MDKTTSTPTVSTLAIRYNRPIPGTLRFVVIDRTQRWQRLPGESATHLCARAKRAIKRDDINAQTIRVTVQQG